MTTTIVSARIDSVAFELAKDKLRSIGKTPSEYIQELWNTLAYSDTIPEFDDIETIQSIRRRAVEEMNTKNHELATQSLSHNLINSDPDDLREIWSSRDF